MRRLCIFSKKHIENPPELKSQKSRHNRNVMKTMQQMFTEGGKVIWVAPSGGRDRSDEAGKFAVAPFDSKSVEMFRLMADKAGKKDAELWHARQANARRRCSSVALCSARARTTSPGC